MMSQPINPQRVLVTGATGAVGPVVVTTLVAAGWQVRALVRTPPPAGLLPATVEVTVGDLTQPATLPAAVAACDAVVHLAALLHINQPPATLHAAYTAVNVDGTRNLLQAAQVAGVQRFLLVSTIAVYGAQRPGAPPVNEQSAPRPESPYAQSKLCAEGLVLAARRADGHPVGVVLRPAAVYGPRVKGNYQRLLMGLARGRFVPIGPGHNRRTLIYDRDLAAAILLALTHPAAAGHCYNVTDGHTYPLREIIGAICGALGRPVPRVHLPVGLVRWAVGLCEDGVLRLGRQSPIGRATIDKYCEEVVVDGSRLCRDLGFAPQVTLATGWRQVVAATPLQV